MRSKAYTAFLFGFFQNAAYCVTHQRDGQMDRSSFPQEFADRMHRMLWGEDEAFFAACLEQPRKALRLNPLKSISPAAVLSSEYCREPVPWESMGYYYDETLAAGRHPYHEAGVYYIQEPSAMAPVSDLDVREDERILDLCAAPGGKSTQIAGRMKNTGLLISNEIHAGRAKILSGNIERMGLSNTIVTNETPARLCEHFPAFFDKILVDAPCSGEGMFRKNPEAIAEWSMENVALCATRQDEILDAAHEMLRTGGRMVYSTCTFAPEENEGTILRFLVRHPEYRVHPITLADGMEHGDLTYLKRLREASLCALEPHDLPEDGTDVSPELTLQIRNTVRLFPHKIMGEGHFLAVLIKGNEETPSPQREPAAGKSALPAKELSLFRDFQKKQFTHPLFQENRSLILFGDHLYRLPDGAPNLNGLKVLRPGLMLGTFKKDRFEPAHALSHFLQMTDSVNFVDLPGNGILIRKYLNGETLDLSGDEAGKEAKIRIGDAHAPWVLVCVDGCAAGFAKLANGILKNHYPKGLRILL